MHFVVTVIGKDNNFGAYVLLTKREYCSENDARIDASETILENDEVWAVRIDKVNDR